MTLARSRAARLVHTCGQELRHTLTAAPSGSIHQGGLALAASTAALIQIRFAQAPNPNPTQISSGTCRTSLHSHCTAAVRIQSLVCPSLGPLQSLFSTCLARTHGSCGAHDGKVLLASKFNSTNAANVGARSLVCCGPSVGPLFSSHPPATGSSSNHVHFGTPAAGLSGLAI